MASEPYWAAAPLAQHLRLPERDGRDDGEVRTLSAVSDAVSQPLNDRRAVAALTVHQYQRVIGWQIAQVRRSDDRCCVADRLGVNVEGRRHRAHQVAYVGNALANEFLAGNDVHRNGRFGGRARPRAAADDDESRVDRADLKGEVPQNLLASRQFHIAVGAHFKAGYIRR